MKQEDFEVKSEEQAGRVHALPVFEVVCLHLPNLEEGEEPYPSYPLIPNLRSFTLSREMAYRLVEQIAASSVKGKVYSIIVSQYPIGGIVGFDDSFLTREVFSAEGRLISRAMCPSDVQDYMLESETPDYLKYYGRRQEDIAFKSQDLVEVVHNDRAYLACIVKTPMTVEDCFAEWKALKNDRRREELPTDDDAVMEEYGLDVRDDNYTVFICEKIDGEYPVVDVHPCDVYPLHYKLSPESLQYVSDVIENYKMQFDEEGELAPPDDWMGMTPRGDA